MLYKKKPVTIEAVQWTGSNFEEICEFTGSKFQLDPVKQTISIATLEGVMEASKNDFIIKGVQGEFYPCKPDIFEQTYEEVND